MTDHVVTISRKVLEVVWAASCAYFMAYRHVFERTPPTERAELDLEVDTEMDDAMSLLQWAIEDWLHGTDTPWPTGLPRPVEVEEAPDLAFYVTQVALMALAFMLHHELAHHRLSHPASTIETEHEADFGASDWLLGGLDEEDSRFQFRAFGVAVALGLLTAWGIHGERFSSTSHPRPFDRLYNTLDRHVEFGHHPAWGMATVVLVLHIQSSKLPIPTYESFYDARTAVNTYINHMADWEADRTTR